MGSSGTGTGVVEVEIAQCECCGLKEECTPAYIARVRERFHGRWICGLCAEAVKDELCRSQRSMTMEDAVTAHTEFCAQFNANPAVNVAEAIRQLLRRRFESPRALRPTHSSSNLGGGDNVGRPASLGRSTSCLFS